MRLRSRARDLGLTDVEVARRLGLAQGRYSAYVNGSREPDLLLFVRICQVLGTTPDAILGLTAASPADNPAISELLATLRLLDDDALVLVTALVRTVAAHRAGGSAVVDAPKPAVIRRTRGGSKQERTTRG